MISTTNNSGEKEQPYLITGASLRKTTISLDQLTAAEKATENEDSSEVQALNQVNQALNAPEIISDSLPNPFIPYLLVHNISRHNSSDSQSNSNNQDKAWKSTGKPKTAPTVPSSSYALKPPPESPMLVPMAPDMNTMTQSWGMSDEEEQDVEIVGITNPPPPPVYSSTTSSTVDTINRKTEIVVNDSGVGEVLQCIALPSQVNSHHCVSSITPTCDSRYIVVTVSPRSLNRKLNLLASYQNNTSSNNCDGTNENDCGTSSQSSSSGTSGSSSYILLYKVQPSGNGKTVLNEQPVCSSVHYDLGDAVQSVVMLPPEVGQQGDEDEVIAGKWLSVSLSYCLPTKGVMND